MGAGGGQAPAIVGWESTSPLSVDVGDEKAARVGQAVYLLPLGVELGGQTTFPDELMSHSIVSSEAAEALDQGSAYSLSRGVMVVDFGPVPFDGSFVPTRLALVMTQGDPSIVVAAPSTTTGPLPETEQPDQDDAVGEEAGAFPADGMPELQLFDRTTGTWQEFAHLAPGQDISVADPQRYVDSAGHFLVRFVDRQGAGAGSTYFGLSAELQGSLP
jgi:hypothetical protein